MNCIRSLAKVLVPVVVLGWLGCSGGGGSSSGNVLVVHGELDESPVAVAVGDTVLPSVRYAESLPYAPVPAGQATVKVTRDNSPSDILATIAANIEKGASYTIVVTGQTSSQTNRVFLVTDEEPDLSSGEGGVRFINSYHSSQRLRLTVGGASSDYVAEGSVANAVHASSGNLKFTIETENGNELTSGTVHVVSGQLVTVAAMGSRSLGLAFAPVYAH